MGLQAPQAVVKVRYFRYVCTPVLKKRRRKQLFFKETMNAQMAKLVDAPSSGGGAVRCAGSSPVLGTSILSSAQVAKLVDALP